MKPVGRPTEHAERSWRARDGINLFARDYPAGPGRARLPVICLHGLTRNSRDFEDIAPVLASWGRRVIVPDVRGRGRSDRDPDPMKYQLRTYANDVIDLLDDLGIRRAVFVGTSMGGLITMALAMTRRSAVAGVVLNDIGPEIAPEGIARISSYAGKPVQIASWDDAIAYAQRTTSCAYPDFGEEDWRTFVSRAFREDANGVPVLDYDPGIARPIAAGRIKLAAWISWLMFRRSTRGRPALLIRGALSDIVTPRIAQRMCRKSRGLRVVEVPRVGHAPTLSEPVAREALSDFLKEAP